MGNTTAVGRRTRAMLLGAVMVVALAATSCATPPTTNTDGATLSVSKSTGLDPAGETITITGTGFSTTGNLGTRPPLFNAPAGVYVVFGSFGENWRPSQGGSQRQVITQRWALIPSSFSAIAGLAGSSAELVQLDADGNFSVDVTVSQVDGTYETLAIATYAGSGAVNAGEEFLIPLEFAAAS